MGRLVLTNRSKRAAQSLSKGSQQHATAQYDRSDLRCDITEAESRRIVVTAEPKDIHPNPAGTVHGSLAAKMLDSYMGLAIQSTLERGVASTTLEFKISFVRPITATNRPITAEGTVISRVCRVGTAEGRVTDSEGRLLVHGTPATAGGVVAASSGIRLTPYRASSWRISCTRRFGGTAVGTAGNLGPSLSVFTFSCGCGKSLLRRLQRRLIAISSWDAASPSNIQPRYMSSLSAMAAMAGQVFHSGLTGLLPACACSGGDEPV